MNRSVERLSEVANARLFLVPTHRQTDARGRTLAWKEATAEAKWTARAG